MYGKFKKNIHNNAEIFRFKFLILYTITVYSRTHENGIEWNVREYTVYHPYMSVGIVNTTDFCVVFFSYMCPHHILDKI